MSSKYLREARECLEKVTAGKPARLDASTRRGMIGELRARGVKVYKERADAFVAQRYVDSTRADTWSDEARAAALEARRARAKAGETNSPADHAASAEASRKAADAHSKAGDEAAAKGDWKGQHEHAAAALSHGQDAQISAEKAGAAPSTVKISMPRSPVVPKNSPHAQGPLGPSNPAVEGGRPTTVSGGVPGRPQTSGVHTVPGTAPASIQHAGAEWGRTGKIGTDRKTGEPSAEYSKIGTNGATRLWANHAGKVTEGGEGENEKANRAATRASAKALAASREARIAGTPEQHAKAAAAHAKAATAQTKAGMDPSGHREEMTRHKLTGLGKAASNATAIAKRENTVATHGEASTAHNAAAKAATKAGATSTATSHKAAAAEHLAAMHNVHNANTQTSAREHAASSIGKAESAAREKSAAANKLTASMRGGGASSEHDKAASAHHYAKKAWASVESHYRASGNEFKASAAHGYSEQHSVKESDHREAANQLRAGASGS